MRTLLKALEARRPDSDDGAVLRAAQHVHQGAVTAYGSTASGTTPWARANTYLWQRLLAPVPLFDLDTALLIALAQKTQVATRTSVLLEKARDLPADDGGEYAKAFIDVVERMRVRAR